MVAQSFSSADLSHGPIAMVDEGFPVFAFAPTGVTWPAMAQTLPRLKSMKATVLAIGDRSNSTLPPATTICIPSEIPELLTPIPHIVPAQMFAAHLAAVEGLCPERAEV